MPKNPKPALRIFNDRLQQELLFVVTKSIKPNKRPQRVTVLREIFPEEREQQNNRESTLYHLLQKALKDSCALVPGKNYTGKHRNTKGFE